MDNGRFVPGRFWARRRERFKLWWDRFWGHRPSQDADRLAEAIHDLAASLRATTVEGIKVRLSGDYGDICLQIRQDT